MTGRGVMSRLHEVTNNNFMLHFNALKKLFNLIHFRQIRWYCYTSDHERTVHIQTKDTELGRQVTEYMVHVGQGVSKPASCGSFEQVGNDDSRAAQNCDKWGYDRQGQLPLGYGDYCFDVGYRCDQGDVTKGEGQWAVYVR